MEKDFRSFRTAAFGGFNKKDVITYIEKVQNEYFEYKKQVEATVDGLNKKIRELENAAGLAERAAFLAQRAAEQEENVQVVEQIVEESPAIDIGQATVQLMGVVDGLCKSLGEFMDRLNSNGTFELPLVQSAQEPQIAEEESEQEISVVDSVLSAVMSLGDEGFTAVSACEAQECSVGDILSKCAFIQ